MFLQKIKVQEQFLVLLLIDFTFYQHFLKKTYFYFILFLWNPSFNWQLAGKNSQLSLHCCAWRLGGKFEILGFRKKLFLLICTYIHRAVAAPLRLAPWQEIWNSRFSQKIVFANMYTGPSLAGWLFLAKQSTLSQPGGQIIPTTVLRAPPNFQTLWRALHISLKFLI